MIMAPSRRRGAFVASALLSAALVFTGCAGGTDDSGDDDTTTSETRQFEADNGTIDVPTDPQRIIAIGNAVGPTINLGVEPVGVTESIFFATQNTWFSDEETAAYEAAENVGTGAEVDFEAMAALQPDLIVINAPDHAWEKYAPDEDQYQSVAPTVWISDSSDDDWTEANRRLADLVGKSDVYEPLVQEYDALLEEMRKEFSSEIETLTFAALTRYANTPEGEVTLISTDLFAARDLEELGFTTTECPDGAGNCGVSMEQLSDLEADVLVYPMEPDGEPTVDFAPVVESNVWRSLPQVVDGRAFGIKSPSNVLVVNQGIGNLTELREALRDLAG